MGTGLGCGLVLRGDLHRGHHGAAGEVDYALVGLGLYLSYRILGPFIVALTWAMMLAVLCHGMQAALSRKTTAGRAG